jgi:hypothetical protein
VERDGTVGFDPQNVLDRHFGAAPGGPLPGESVTVDPYGGIIAITGLYINMGETIAKGVDWSASYLLRNRTLGRFDFNVSASYLASIRIAEVPGIPPVENVDQPTDSGASDGYLRWKGTATVSWKKEPFGVSVTARYTDGFMDIDLDGDPYRIGSTLVYDSQVTINLSHWSSRWLHETKLILGGRDITDVSPPLAFGQGGSNSTRYPNALYSAEGLFLYASLERKF